MVMVYLECFVFKLINYYLRRTSLCSNSKLDFGDFESLDDSLGGFYLKWNICSEHHKIFLKNAQNIFSEM